MKYISKFLFAALGFVALFAACNKADDLPVYNNGMAVTLTSSVTTIAPAPADSNNVAIVFRWTNPNYAQDSSLYKFVVEIDSAGRNFSKASRKTFTGTWSGSFIAKEINAIALSYGFAFNTAYDMEARVISSYGNNNERYFSNVIKLKVTPYKVPPIVALPSTGRLFITGDATDFGWSNPAPMPAIRELTRLDETTWAGIFHMSGGGGYLLLQTAGNWDDKFSVLNSTGPTGEAGSFGFKLNDNFPGSLTGGNGWYKNVYNFQTGKYTLTKQTNALSPDLYITGDATPGGWVNNPPAGQKMTMLTSGVFEITMAFVPGKAYKFLNTSGQWQPQFGGPSATGGALGANYGGGSDPSNIPTPDVAGNYKIQVNFITNTYTVTKI